MESPRETGRDTRRDRDSNWQAGGPTPTLTSHLPPWARHHAIFILSQSASEPVSQSASEPARQSNRQDSPQRCFSFFSSQSAPQPHRLVSALTHRSVSVKLCSDYQNLIWGGLLTNPPTHSKSKCAIKNAHLTSSSRLPNAYASYLRDQEKWYCKRYRISFIRYTIQISSGGDWWVFFPLALPCRLNLGKVWNRYRTCWKTPIWMLVRQPSTYSNSLSLSPSPTKCEISSDVLCESENDAT